MTDERQAEHDTEMDEWMNAPMGAAPSTDEGEARGEAWANYDLHEWERERWLEKYPENGERIWNEEQTRLRIQVEAAIRAPLEERIRNLLARIFRDGGQRTATFSSLDEACAQADIEAAEFIARAEAFGEALRLIERLATFNASTHAKGGILDTARNALAPPSATEGTPSGSRVIPGRVIREGTKAEVEG